MRKRIIALFLALVLCMGLAIPASADYAPIVLTERIVTDNGNGSKSIKNSEPFEVVDGDSGNGWSMANGKLTFNNFAGSRLEVNGDTTIVLAPGSKNTVEYTEIGFLVGNGIYNVNLTIEGTGEIDFHANSSDYGTFKFIPGGKITLGAGLVMTGGNKATERNPLTFDSEGYPVTSDGTRAKYVHIGPGSSDSAPAQPATTTPPASASKFTDVSPTSPYASAIAWAVEKGIAKGTTDTTFSPNEICTRRQLETFLWRANGSPEHPNSPEGAYDTIWATDQKLIPYFYSDEEIDAYYALPCTRSLAVTFMWKLAGSPEPKKTSSFSDVPANEDYAKAVSWAVEQGITTGTSATTFSPDSTCTRGQIVTFLYRASK